MLPSVNLRGFELRASDDESQETPQVDGQPGQVNAAYISQSERNLKSRIKTGCFTAVYNKLLVVVNCTRMLKLPCQY